MQTLRQQIEASPAWHARDVLLQSMPDLGPVTSTTLVAELPERGTRTAKQVATLVGVAPVNRDSGSYRGTRDDRRGPHTAAVRALHGDADGGAQHPHLPQRPRRTPHFADKRKHDVTSGQHTR